MYNRRTLHDNDALQLKFPRGEGGGGIGGVKQPASRAQKCEVHLAALSLCHRSGLSKVSIKFFVNLMADLMVDTFQFQRIQSRTIRSGTDRNGGN